MLSADPFIGAAPKRTTSTWSIPFITIIMTTIKLPTVEGHEIELDVADHEKLRAWPDMDLSCIYVVGDDALHALKPSTGKLHALSLEEMLMVQIKPCKSCHEHLPETFFPSSRHRQGYRSTCTRCRNTRRRALKASEASPASVPTPGPPGDLLKRYARTLAPRSDSIWVIVDGEPRDVPPITKDGQWTRVPLCDPERVFVGFADLDTFAYEGLISPLIKASRWLWVLQPNGEVVTRATTHLGGLGTYSVRRLMRDHGIVASLVVERVRCIPKQV